MLSAPHCWLVTHSPANLPSKSGSRVLNIYDKEGLALRPLIVTYSVLSPPP